MKQKGYDLESVYDEKIQPLMLEIIKICQEYKMPMLATFQYKHNGKNDNDSMACTTRLCWADIPENKCLAAATAIIHL